MSDGFEPRYKVKATKTARKQGEKLGIAPKEHLRIIRQLKRLKFWPDNQDEFEHEIVNGAIKFDFNTAGQWVRAFFFQDDDRKIMWLIKVMAKKTNRLAQADLISLDVAVRGMKQEIQRYQKALEEQKKKLTLLRGGKR